MAFMVGNSPSKKPFSVPKDEKGVLHIPLLG
jgi:hypothetical protein